MLRLLANDAVTDAPDGPEAAHGAGPDRREVVNYQAEDRDGGGASAHQFILRPEVCRPTLSPLHFNEMTPGQSRGRMANMFGEKTRIVDDNGANK